MSTRFICIIYNLSAILLRITACCSRLQALKSSFEKYDHATQTITQISVGKCTPVQLKQLYFMQILLAAEVGDTRYKKSVFNPLYRNSWHKRWISIWTRTYHLIEAEEMDRLISALKFTPTRKEHILRKFVRLQSFWHTVPFSTVHGMVSIKAQDMQSAIILLKYPSSAFPSPCPARWSGAWSVCIKKQKVFLIGKAARRIIAVSYAALTLLYFLIGYSFLIVSFWRRRNGNRNWSRSALYLSFRTAWLRNRYTVPNW